MGLIDKVWEAGGKRYLSIDYEELLTGQAAIDAAKAAGDPPPEDDYYISNVNPKKREFTVSASVVITTATRSGGMDEPATWADFLSFWSPSPPSGAEHLHMGAVVDHSERHRGDQHRRAVPPVEAAGGLAGRAGQVVGNHGIGASTTGNG
jgi:hypothetical protein